MVDAVDTTRAGWGCAPVAVAVELRSDGPVSVESAFEYPETDRCCEGANGDRDAAPACATPSCMPACLTVCTLSDGTSDGVWVSVCDSGMSETRSGSDRGRAPGTGPGSGDGTARRPCSIWLASKVGCGPVMVRSAASSSSWSSSSLLGSALASSARTLDTADAKERVSLSTDDLAGL